MICEGSSKVMSGRWIPGEQQDRRTTHVGDGKEEPSSSSGLLGSVAEDVVGLREKNSGKSGSFGRESVVEPLHRSPRRQQRQERPHRRWRAEADCDARQQERLW